MNDRVQTAAAEQFLAASDDISELLFHVAVFNPDEDADIPLDLWTTRDDEQDAIGIARDIHSDHPDLNIAVQPRINRVLQDATFCLSAN